MKAKKLFKRVFLFGFSVVLCSTIIALLMGEFIVKHMIPQETYNLARMVGVHIFQESTIIPFTLQKNIKKVMHIAFTREFTHFISTNSQGTRGGEFSIEKPKDVYRIIFLGDSMTFGWGVEDDRAYPTLVEKYLNQALLPGKKYNKIEVVNVGFTDCLSPDSYYLYYKDIASKYNPDLVIVNLFPYNDLSDMYYNSWEKVDDNGYPTKIISKTHKVVDGYLVSRKKTNWKFEIPILRNSHVGILFFNALDKGAPDLVNLIKKVVGVKEEKEVFSKEEDNKCIYSVEEKNCPKELWPSFEKIKFIFRGIKTLVQKDSHSLLVTIMASPDQAIPLSKKEDKLKILDSIQPQKYFRDFLSNEKIEYLDLLENLSQNNTEHNFFHQDGHINESGHKSVAKEITQFLIKKDSELFNKSMVLQ